VPSLASALDALPEGMILAVDVKTPWAVWPLVREVRRRRLESRTLVWCQSALACRYVAKQLPAVEVAYLKTTQTPDEEQRFLARAREAGARAISAHWLAIDSEFVGRAHRDSLRVFSWHEGYPLDGEKLTSGLDILVTDYPVEARRAIESIEQDV
jgi:hypothetical protein